MKSKHLDIRTLSSLAKVFPKRIRGNKNASCQTLRGQEISFQIAYRERAEKGLTYQTNYFVDINSPLKDSIRIYKVGYVPSKLPLYPSCKGDPEYLKITPGLFPDPITEWNGEEVTAATDEWRTLWITVKIDESCNAGAYPIDIVFTNAENGTQCKTTYTVNVQPFSLPKQELIFTQWFHCDCIASVHNVKIFSEEHWSLIETYLSLATQHGMNMLLTPILTLPLDTEIGGERPTVQLVGITKEDNVYRFDFSKLVRFIRMALKTGIRYFEISHFFTQWGAAFTPKVVAEVNGEVKKIFGWETSATDPEYSNFLSQLIPAVIDCFENEGIERNRLYFHVSDEPSKDHAEQYNKVSAIIRPLIMGCHHIDALSNYEFYETGMVEKPIPPVNRITPFLEANVPDLWCYYCCSQGYQVSNRFFALPLARTRMIGVQMYASNIKGFLHWGYNFYYSALSKRHIDPYKETDGDGAFPSGDAFSVYPTEKGATPSLRQKVFANALEDMRLLMLLENKIGREQTLSLLERVAGEKITFTTSKSEDFFENLYKAIFEELTK